MHHSCSNNGSHIVVDRLLHLLVVLLVQEQLLQEEGLLPEEVRVAEQGRQGRERERAAGHHLLRGIRSVQFTDSLLLLPHHCQLKRALQRSKRDHVSK